MQELPREVWVGTQPLSQPVTPNQRSQSDGCSPKMRGVGVTYPPTAPPNGGWAPAGWQGDSGGQAMGGGASVRPGSEPWRMRGLRLAPATCYMAPASRDPRVREGKRSWEQAIEDGRRGMERAASRWEPETVQRREKAASELSEWIGSMPGSVGSS